MTWSDLLLFLLFILGFLGLLLKVLHGCGRFGGFDRLLSERLGYRDGLLLCIELFSDILSDELISRRNEGNADEHSSDAHNAAADGDRGKHPESGETDRFADDLRVDEVALKLLKNDEEDDEEESLDRRFGHYHNCAYRAADIGTRNGNKSGKAYQRADHGRIGETEDPHSDSAENAEDDSLLALTDDEVLEADLDRFDNMVEFLTLGEFEVAFFKSDDLRADLLLAEKNIDREDEADDRGDYTGEYRCNGRDHNIKNASDARCQYVEYLVQI